MFFSSKGIFLWYMISLLCMIQNSNILSIFLNNLKPLFLTASVVDGLDQQISLALRSDNHFDLFFLCLVKSLGNIILEAEGNLGVLEQVAVLRVDFLVRATLLFGSQRAMSVCLRYPIPVGHCQ